MRRKKTNWILLAVVAVATYMFKDKISPIIDDLKSKISK